MSDKDKSTVEWVKSKDSTPLKGIYGSGMSNIKIVEEALCIAAWGSLQTDGDVKYIRDKCKEALAALPGLIDREAHIEYLEGMLKYGDTADNSWNSAIKTIINHLRKDK